MLEMADVDPLASIPVKDDKRFISKGNQDNGLNVSVLSGIMLKSCLQLW